MQIKIKIILDYNKYKNDEKNMIYAILFFFLVFKSNLILLFNFFYLFLLLNKIISLRILKFN